MYELKSRVRYSEADENGVLTVTSLLNYLQDCCTMQAEDLGIGLSYLKEHGIGWMVTSYEIFFEGSMPKVGDAIRVFTWPYRFRGMLGYRNFLVTYEDGTKIASVDSLWVLMDLIKLQPKKLPEDMIEAYELFDPLPGEWSERKKLAGSAEREDKHIEVSDVMVDTNGHMNNVYYFDLSARLLQPEESFSKVYIQYKKSAHLGDKISAGRKDTADGVEVSLFCGDEVLCVVQFYS